MRHDAATLATPPKFLLLHVYIYIYTHSISEFIVGIVATSRTSVWEQSARVFFE